MFIFGNFMLALANLTNLMLTAYIWIVVFRAALSWVNADPYNPIVRFLMQVTDPVLAKLRRYVPPISGVDLSPVILILALVFLQSFLVQTLREMGTVLR